MPRSQVRNYRTGVARLGIIRQSALWRMVWVETRLARPARRAAGPQPR